MLTLAASAACVGLGGGPVTDVLGLAVVLAGSDALGAFSSALPAWLRLRRPGATVGIRVRNEGGTTIEESRIADDPKPGAIRAHRREPTRACPERRGIHAL
ncbi:hypothetical protein [Nonomuraea sp. NPDC049758]|uniref:effector-associated constant component EACC1 n=1 Tax=Nonomuraea sp. NPDC049758 TaxID=3154360 RepID=UPI003431EFEB